MNLVTKFDSMKPEAVAARIGWLKSINVPLPQSQVTCIDIGWIAFERWLGTSLKLTEHLSGIVLVKEEQEKGFTGFVDSLPAPFLVPGYKEQLVKSTRDGWNMALVYYSSGMPELLTLQYPRQYVIDRLVQFGIFKIDN